MPKKISKKYLQKDFITPLDFASPPLVSWHISKRRQQELENEFFQELLEKFEEFYSKGDKGRGKALLFNAFANMTFRKILSNLTNSKKCTNTTGK